MFKKSMADYEAVKRFMDESLKTGVSGSVEIGDIEKFYNELTSLPLMGPEIKKNFEIVKKTAEKLLNRNQVQSLINKDLTKFCNVHCIVLNLGCMSTKNGCKSFFK